LGISLILTDKKNDEKDVKDVINYEKILIDLLPSKNKIAYKIIRRSV